MKNKATIFLTLVVFFATCFFGQNTYSPYSRYAIGELAQPTFAHNAGMGGAFVALKSDSTLPNFINVGNPASYALIRLTTLELGVNMVYSNFQNTTNSVNKRTANFTYGALGFPVRGNGGISFGIMPFTYVGSTTSGTVDEPGVGDVTYRYDGSGGLNKIFLGYGILPFNKRLIKFRKKHLFVDDSLKTMSGKHYRIAESVNKLLSDFSIGANGNYIKGNIVNAASVVYPENGQYFNTYRERVFSLSDFTANFGMQTAFTFDSVRVGANKRRAMRQKVKLTFGYTFNLNNKMQSTYNALGYNYRVSNGQNVIVDTVFNTVEQASSITLPFEQGFGIGFKKGEKLNMVFDYAITKWQNFKYIENVSELKQNHRFAFGVNFVPDKYALGRGTYFQRINYRLGANYQSGYISINNELISSYSISAGLGIPVGISRNSSMVHISAQYGIMGTTKNNLIQENFWKINLGFTFSDKWFQKYKYD